MQKTLDDLGTQFQSMEVNKTGKDGQMMMDIVEAVTGSRMVPAIFICGQLVPGGGTGLKHLASTGQLSDILGKCCDEMSVVNNLTSTASTSPHSSLKLLLCILYL